MPLAATLKQAGLKLDVEAANQYIGRWLTGDDPLFWTPAILNRRGHPSWPRLERRMPLLSGSK